MWDTILRKQPGYLKITADPARPLLIDLGCKAGGASFGYWLAGFRVIGIDKEPQPNYPFDFVQDDFLAIDLGQFGASAFAASPHCQHYSFAAMKVRDQYPDQIPAVRDRLKATGKPYIIENVVGAPLINTIELRGTMFGLRVIRPRLFESNVSLIAPQDKPKVGSVSTGEYIRVVGNGGGNHGISDLEVWKEAMGIDWMIRKELTQAIPPAYTEWLGRQLISNL